MCLRACSKQGFNDGDVFLAKRNMERRFSPISYSVDVSTCLNEKVDAIPVFAPN